MIQPNDLQIDRIIIHRVHKKELDEVGYAEHSNNLFMFGNTEIKTLKERICSAFSKSKRFFKLSIARIEKESFFGYSQGIKNCDKDVFIEKSKNIADLLAESHNRRNIPSGLLIIMDGYFNSSHHFILAIKAELQSAFTIEEINNQKDVKLIGDLFLSPAKDFYKIGYLVEDFNEEGLFPNSDYSAYMYDDNFTSGKADLAEYFYKTFLGFSTGRNEKLLCKNHHKDVSEFIAKYVSKFVDQKGLREALNSLYRENTTGVINPQEFAELNFDKDLLSIYNAEVSHKYEYSFKKDLEFVDKRLQRGKIELTKDLKIEGTTSALENINVINSSNVDIRALKLSLDNGEIDQIVTIKTERKNVKSLQLPPTVRRSI